MSRVTPSWTITVGLFMASIVMVMRRMGLELGHDHI
jgi:hypothetical protein